MPTMTTDVKFHPPAEAEFLSSGNIRQRNDGKRAVMPDRADLVAVVAHNFGITPARAEYALMVAFEGREP